MFYHRNTSEMQEILRFIIDEFKARIMGQIGSPRIRKEISVLCKKGAMQQVTAQRALKIPRFYSRMFCVPKPGKIRHPVINLKHSSQFVKKLKFHIETKKM